MQEVKDILKFASELLKSGEAALEDGKVGLDDIMQLVGPFTALPAAISGASSAPAELAALDEAGRAELKAYVVEELDLKDDEVEKAYELCLKVVIDIVALFQMRR